jgi:hypothetical protein
MSDDANTQLPARPDRPVEGPVQAQPPEKRDEIEELLSWLDSAHAPPQDRIVFPVTLGVHTKTNPLRLRVTSPTGGVGDAKREHVIKVWPTSEFGKKKRHVAFAVVGDGRKPRKAVLKEAEFLGTPIEMLRGGEFVGDIRSTDVSVANSA